MERTYERYEFEEEKRASFLKWEREVQRLAAEAGVSSRRSVGHAGAM